MNARLTRFQSVVQALAYGSVWAAMSSRPLLMALQTYGYTLRFFKVPQWVADWYTRLVVMSTLAEVTRVARVLAKECVGKVWWAGTGVWFTLHHLDFSFGFNQFVESSQEAVEGLLLRYDVLDPAKRPLRVLCDGIAEETNLMTSGLEVWVTLNRELLYSIHKGGESFFNVSDVFSTIRGRMWSCCSWLSSCICRALEWYSSIIICLTCS